MNKLAALTLLAFCFTANAQAQNPPGWDAFVAGNLRVARQEARTAAEQKATADSFALACRAGLAIGGFLETGEPAVLSLHGAIEDCEKALKIDPKHYVAALSHAIAIGFEGLRLRKASYARASKREIEQFIQHYPQNALARGSLAGWHAAVAEEGWLARLFLGASRARAKSLYAEALLLPNLETPLTYEYIRFLASGNRQDREKAMTLANEVLMQSPKDGFEAVLHTKLEPLLDALRRGDKNSIKQSISEATPFIGIDNWGKPDRVGLGAFPLWEQEAPR